MLDLQENNQTDNKGGLNNRLPFFPELLSPAGNIASAYGALNAGADAVYLGASVFSARAFAENLSEDEIKELITYAHILGKKIYLTSNILVKDREFQKLFETVDPLYEKGLDGCIIQDIGVLMAFHERYPSMQLHASTQMSVLSAEGAAYLRRFGVNRVVPGRELSLSEIKAIKATGMEVECFIHGAMCYSYSGRCLLSSFAGGRSGNRGRCAGPCRQKYSVSGSDPAYLLSMKDMCAYPSIPELIDAGVDSFKIEGRMKDAEYTAGVTHVYRKLIDRYLAGKDCTPDAEDKEILESLYIRSERQEGYLHKHNGREMISITAPAYVKTPDELKKKIRDRFLTEKKNRKLKGKLSIKCGEPAVLTLGLCDDPSVNVSLKGFVPEKAMKTGSSDTDLAAKVRMTGGTGFEIDALDISNDGISFVPVKEIKELRRKALEELSLKLAPERTDLKADSSSAPDKGERAKEISYRAGVRTGGQFDAVIKSRMISSVIMPLDLFEADPDVYLDKTASAGKNLYLRLPVIIREKDAASVKERLKAILDKYSVCGIYVSGIDAIAAASGLVKKEMLKADTGFYAMNSRAARGILELTSGFTADVESSFAEIKDLCEHEAAELLIYGYIPVMYSAGCVMKTLKGCDKNTEGTVINDEKGHAFHVIFDHRYCCNIMLNCYPLSLHNRAQDIIKAGAAGTLRLEFLTEDEKDVKDILSYYEEVFVNGNGDAPIPGSLREYTGGHFSKAVD